MNARRRFIPGWLVRLLAVIVISFTVGAIMNRLADSLQAAERRAGFWRGVMQGALMPMALPNLLVGRDVVIYSTENSGVRYKLGYTVGVNACGALFFGVLYWRLLKWRQRSQSSLAEVRSSL